MRLLDVNQMKYLFLTLFFLPLSLVAQDSWTLERCITHALENNLELKRQGLNSALADHQYKQAKADFLPSLNGDLNHSYNFGRSVDPTTYEFVNQTVRTNSFSLNSGLTLFSGLRKFNTYKQRQTEVSAANSDADDTRNTIILGITQAYLQILLSREELIKASAQKELTASQLDNTEKLVQAGTLPEGNILEMEAQVARDEMLIVVAKNTLDIARLTMMQMLDLAPETDFEIDQPIISVPDKSSISSIESKGVFETALQTQPSILSAELRVKSSQYGLSATRGLYYPSLSFFLNSRTNYSSLAQSIVDEFEFYPTIGYTEDNNTDVISSTPFSIPTFENTSYVDQLNENFNNTVGFSMSVPILNGLQTRMAVQSAKVQLQQAELADEITRQSLQKEVYQAIANAQAAAEQFESSENAVTAQSKATEYAQEKFKAGLISAFELSTAQNLLNTANSEFIKAKYDYLFKLKIVDFYQGKELTLQ